MEYKNPIPKILRHPFRIFSVARMILSWLKIYFSTQSEAKITDAQVIETELDERIQPDERGIYPYLFACVYILYVSWFVLDKLTQEQYRKAYDSYLDMILQAKKIFIERPTRMKDRRRSPHPLILFTQSVDGPTNCFPSLHVALVMLSYQIIKDNEEVDALLLSAMKRSCVDICRSTMQTKQHSIADVIGGIELSRRIYMLYFDGRFEDFMDDILPELSGDELKAIRKMLQEETDWSDMLEKLLQNFTLWAK